MRHLQAQVVRRVGVEASLIATKLYIPQVRPDLVRRPRLVDRLSAGLHRKLTLISAPAGSGKTTLLCDWVGQQAQPGSPPGSGRLHPSAVAWLSLDPADNDPGRFFTYLIAALQRVHGEIGATLAPALRAARPPSPDALITALVNQVAALPYGPDGPQIVLVLEDYHLITELAVHQAVNLLVERQPPQLHLVITTRQDPPLPLSSLRARDQLTEIRQRDLRFSAQEVAAFLTGCMKLQLTPAEMDALEERTEGWIAGLQMAALSLQGLDRPDASRSVARFSGRHHFVLDYLTDEVLGRQPDPVQRFLLQTAVLDRLCASLCGAVVDAATSENGGDASPAAQEMLEHIAAANLFLIPLDDERRWYRYHHLFAELLRARLQEVQPGQALHLHRRAARWYEENGLPVDAVHHALASADMDLAADLMQRIISRLGAWSDLDVATIHRWLMALPEEVSRTRPYLRLFTARTLYAAGQPGAAYRVMEELERTLQAGPDSPETAALLAKLAVDRASFAAAQGEVSRTIAFAEQALARAAADDLGAQIRALSLLGLAHYRAGAVQPAAKAFNRTVELATAMEMTHTAVPLVCHLAELHLMEAQLGAALAAAERARQLGTVAGKPVAAVGFAEVETAKVLYQRNDLAAAETHARRALELLSSGGIAETFGSAPAILAQIRQARGDPEGALAAADEAVSSAEKLGIPRLAHLATAYRARIWLAQARAADQVRPDGEKLRLAGRWADDYRHLPAAEYLRELEELTLARVLLAQSQPARALATLDQLLPAAEGDGRVSVVIETQTLRALALAAWGQIDAALSALSQALALARPEGFVRLFLDEGQPMAQLLRRFQLDQGDSSDFARQLLAAFAGEEHSLLSPDAVPPAGLPRDPAYPLVEPLSGREMEVLQLLAGGLTNAEIAQRLTISLPTVKSHTRNIYGKLNVHGRRQAVARARSLNLLPRPNSRDL
jgi:LuxR family maltose regulon positive regulatory protein